MITSSNFFSIDLAAPKACKGTTGAIIDVDSYWKLTPHWKVKLAPGSSWACAAARWRRNSPLQEAKMATA
jgi:hypothetical protein